MSLTHDLHLFAVADAAAAAHWVGARSAADLCWCRCFSLVPLLHGLLFLLLMVVVVIFVVVVVAVLVGATLYLFHPVRFSIRTLPFTSGGPLEPSTI